MDLPLTLLVIASTFGFLHASRLSVPPVSCIGYPDSMDLGPDDNYYYFSGAHVFSADKMNHIGKPVQLISGVFSTVEFPVVAAFSTGPKSKGGRMFLIDSASSDKNVKMFQFDSGTVPRTPERTGSLIDFFPSADTEFPTPVTAALAMVQPPQVYFFGGPSEETENRRAAKYSFDPATSVFTLEPATILKRTFWKSRTQAAAPYYSKKSRAITLYAFNSTGAVKVEPNLDITSGPTLVTGKRAEWLPVVLAEACASIDPTTTVASTTLSLNSTDTSTESTITTDSVATTAGVVSEDTSPVIAAETLTTVALLEASSETTINAPTAEDTTLLTTTLLFVPLIPNVDADTTALPITTSALPSGLVSSTAAPAGSTYEEPTVPVSSKPAKSEPQITDSPLPALLPESTSVQPNIGVSKSISALTASTNASNVTVAVVPPAEGMGIFWRITIPLSVLAILALAACAGFCCKKKPVPAGDRKSSTELGGSLSDRTQVTSNNGRGVSAKVFPPHATNSANSVGSGNGLLNHLLFVSPAPGGLVLPPAVQTFRSQISIFVDAVNPDLDLVQSTITPVKTLKKIHRAISTGVNVDIAPIGDYIVGTTALLEGGTVAPLAALQKLHRTSSLGIGTIAAPTTSVNVMGSSALTDEGTTAPLKTLQKIHRTISTGVNTVTAPTGDSTFRQLAFTDGSTDALLSTLQNPHQTISTVASAQSAPSTTTLTGEAVPSVGGSHSYTVYAPDVVHGTNVAKGTPSESQTYVFLADTPGLTPDVVTDTSLSPVHVIGRTVHTPPPSLLRQVSTSTAQHPGSAHPELPSLRIQLPHGPSQARNAGQHHE